MTQLQIGAVLRASPARTLFAAALVAGSVITGASAAPLIDPTGDTFAVDSSGCDSQPSGVDVCVSHHQIYDLTSINAVVEGSSLVFGATFASSNTIIAPSTNDPNMLGGYIDIDADQNPLTGYQSWSDYLAGTGMIAPGVYLPGTPTSPSGLGIEYYVDLYSEINHAGMVEIWDGSGMNMLGLAPILYGSDSFKITVPLILLGGDDGLVNYDVLVGNEYGPTDIAQNPDLIAAGALPAASVIPEPSSVALFGLILVGIGFVRQRRRAT